MTEEHDEHHQHGEHPCHQHRNVHRMVFGGCVLVIGVLALLGNLHLVDIHSLLHFWPLVFIVMGLLHMVKRRYALAYVWGGGLVVLGAVLVLKNLGVLPLSSHDFWPLFLIFGGGYVMAKGFLPHQNHCRHRRQRWRARGPSEPLSRAEHGGGVQSAVFMSGSALRNDSQDFQGGELSAVMGGVELDLRQASMQTPALLRVLALMSGVVIRVPLDWSVQLKGAPILGALEDKTVPPMATDKRLTVEADIVMSSIEIKN